MNLKSLKHINNFYLVILVISVFGFLLRLLGLNWDQGNLFHPDERQLLMISQRLSINDLDPGWYNYGTLPLYVLEIFSFGMEELNNLRFPGRILSSFFDSVTIFIVGELGKRFHTKLTGVISSIFYSTCILAIQLSHFFTVDTFLNTSIALIFLLCSNLINRLNFKNLFYLSLAIGIGFAIKISIFIICLPVLVTLFFSTNVKINFQKRKIYNLPSFFFSILIVIFVSVLSFSALNPYSIINLNEFINSSRIQSEMARGIIDFPYTRQYENTTPYIYHISQLIKVSLGPFLGIFSVFSLIYVSIKFNKTSGFIWYIFLSWVASYFLFYGFIHTKFIRYLFPIIPIILIFNSYTLISLFDNYFYKFKKFFLFIFSLFLIGILHYFMSYILIGSSEHNANIAAKYIDNNFNSGSILVKEHWDESLPFKNNFIINEIPLYDYDSTSKIQSISIALSNSDGMFISSKRLFGTIPRLDERYPLSTNYYYKLFDGSLGFELLKNQSKDLEFLGVTYFSDPFNRVKNLNFEKENKSKFNINLGWTDESFSVYDRPEIFIFKNSKNLTSEEIFDEIMQIEYENTNFVRAVNVDQNTLYKGIFQNSNSMISTILWLFILNIISLIYLPILWKFFGLINFNFNGHIKIISILFSTYFTWIAVSINLFEFTLLGIYLSLIFPLIASGIIFFRNQEKFITFLRNNFKEILKFEFIFLFSFLTFAIIRSFNPDLWHPFRGGEKPMEISYLSALLNSKNLPPFDPWFSGASMNYYYYGLWIFSNLIALSQINTFIGFNLAVCTVFALSVTTLFAFSEIIFKKNRKFSFLLIFMVLLMGNMQPLMQIKNKFINSNYTEFFNIDFWSPSRVFPAESIGYEISEFPFFSFLFSDLHPHMISIPIFILFINLLVVIFKNKVNSLNLTKFLISSGLIISLLFGTLWATNTWTVPVIFTLLNIFTFLFFKQFSELPIIKSLIYSSIIIFFSYLFFLPFHMNFISPVSSFEISEFSTRFYDFIEIYFIFILIILIFFISSLRKEFTKKLIEDNYKNSFFSILISGIFFIIFVENFKIENDIGRMNTFFKFHLQIWILMSISSCYLLFMAYQYNNVKFKKFLFFPLLSILVISGIIYPIFGTYDRINDRFSKTDITLNGSRFLEENIYIGPNGEIDLSYDYDAIKWIKENVTDVSTIIEGNGPLYSWASRYSIYTGLPTVIGWDWHQVQQRGYDRSLINNRVNDIDEFYSTDNLKRKVEIIEKYNIDLVVIGNLERNKYPSSGINKIETLDNVFEEIYKNDQTTILKAIK